MLSRLKSSYVKLRSMSGHELSVRLRQRRYQLYERWGHQHDRQPMADDAL